ncbi:MAG: hypothetical protein ABEJ42_03425, partial [Halobacteriaceae archaeon]
ARSGDGPAAAASADAGPPEQAAPPAASAGERGPPAELPAQVPDVVGQIHDLIGQHLSGALEVDLGSAISDLLGGEADAGDDAAANATATPDGNATAA